MDRIIIKCDGELGWYFFAARKKNKQNKYY